MKINVTIHKRKIKNIFSEIRTPLALNTIIKQTETNTIKIVFILLKFLSLLHVNLKINAGIIPVNPDVIEKRSLNPGIKKTPPLLSIKEPK